MVTLRAGWRGGCIPRPNCHQLGYGRILVDPSGDEVGGVAGLGGVGEEVVRFFEGEEGFGMFGGGVDFAGVFESDDVVGGGVHDEKTASQVGDAFFLVVTVEVGEKAFADVEFAARKGDFGLALGTDLREVVFEELGDVAGVVGSAESDDVREFGDLAGSGEDSGTSEGVPEDESGGGEVFSEVIGGGDEVLDVGDEGGVGEVSVGIPESCEVEA